MRLINVFVAVCSVAAAFAMTACGAPVEESDSGSGAISGESEKQGEKKSEKQPKLEVEYVKAWNEKGNAKIDRPSGATPGYSFGELKVDSTSDEKREPMEAHWLCGKLTAIESNLILQGVREPYYKPRSRFAGPHAEWIEFGKANPSGKYYQFDVTKLLSLMNTDVCLLVVGVDGHEKFNATLNVKRICSQMNKNEYAKPMVDTDCVLGE
jgi:hypothetical protein